MTFLHRALAVLFDLIAWFAPSDPRRLAVDARVTFRAVCQRAYERHRLAGLFKTAACELGALMAAVVRERADQCRPFARGVKTPSVMALRRDLRLAIRAVWSARATSLLTALILALGVSTTAAAFSVIDSVMLREVPFPDARRLVELWSFSLEQKMTFRMGLPSAGLDAWREQSDLFDRVEGFEGRSFVMTHEGGAEQVPGALVTPGLFEMLGGAPILGRRFLKQDGLQGARPVAIVSDQFWSSYLGRRHDIDAVTVTLDDVRYDVVGVLPPTFRFPSGNEHVWITGSSTQITPLARLAHTVTYERADAAVRARGEQLATSVGGPPGITAAITALGRGADERTDATLKVLAASVGFLLLIVCVNVANLTLSRALSRTRDLATCAALGASRGALFRVAAFEQGLLATAGVVLGWGGARVLLDVAVWALPEVITGGTLNVIDLDSRAVLALVGTGVVTMMVCGVPSAWLAARVPLSPGFRDSARTAGSRFARRLRTSLAVAEVATSVALLVGAAMMTRSFIALTSVDHGYVPQGLISLRLGLPAAGYADAAVARAAVRDAAARVRTLPGVSGVTIGGLPSETGLVAFGPLEVSGGATDSAARVVVPIHEVSESYFDVARLPIRDGRPFRADEIPGAAIINERFAATHFPAAGPVGQRFRVGNGAWRTIVGIAGDTVGDRERGARRIEVYYPLGQAADAARPVRRTSSIAHFQTLLVRADSPRDVVPLLAGAVHERHPAVVVWRTELVERILADAIARPRVALVTILLFSGLGLLLSMVGLYGVLNHLVLQRQQEIGIRMALGADAGSIRRLILRHGFRLTGLGLGLGLAAAWPMISLMRSVLYNVPARDPIALGVAALLVAVTAGLACWHPARQAGRTNPVDLLRA